MAENELDIPFPQADENKNSYLAKKENKSNSGDPTSLFVGVIGAAGAQDRDKLYSILLSTYIQNFQDKQKEAQEQRHTYISYSFIIMIIVALLSSALLLTMLIVDFGTIGNIATAITSMFSLLAALVGIPLTITKHLFPQELDHEIVDIVTCLINNDCEIRKIQSDHDCSTCGKKDNTKY